MDLQVKVKKLQAQHWPQVQAIYAQGIAGGHATFETELPTWQQWDQAHLAQCRLVALGGDAVLGWAALSPVSRRPVYLGVAEVSVYVATSSQGVGLGKTLLEALIVASEAAGIWTLQASMFPENEASIRLHRRCGFHLVGRREKIAQHHGVWRDTLLMERRSKRDHVGT